MSLPHTVLPYYDPNIVFAYMTQQSQNFTLTPTQLQNNGQINQQTSKIQVELPKDQVYRIYQVRNHKNIIILTQFRLLKK